jgi:hypothetical protein
VCHQSERRKRQRSAERQLRAPIAVADNGRHVFSSPALAIDAGPGRAYHMHPATQKNSP